MPRPTRNVIVNSGKRMRGGLPFGLALDTWDAKDGEMLAGISILEPMIGEDGKPVMKDKEIDEEVLDADGQPTGKLIEKTIRVPVKVITGFEKGTGSAPLLTMDVSQAPFDGHGLISGVSGGGKTSGHVGPYIVSYPHSVVVGDPKLENLALVGRSLRRSGKNVYFLSPKRIDTWSLDALCGVRLCSDSMTTKINDIAGLLFEKKKGESNGGGQFYEDVVKKLFNGANVFLFYEWYLAVYELLKKGKELGFVEDPQKSICDPEFVDEFLRIVIVKRLNRTSWNTKPCARALSILARLSPKFLSRVTIDSKAAWEWLGTFPARPTLQEIYRWLCASDFEEQLKKAAAHAERMCEISYKKKEDPHPVIVAMRQTLAGWSDKKSDETWGNVVASIPQKLAFLDDPNIAKLICGKGKKVFMPEDLFDGNSVCFIGVNSSTIRANPGAVKVIYSSFGSAIDDAPGGKVPKDKTILFIIDEAQQLGEFRILHAQWLPEGRGKGIRLVLIIQSPNGLDEAAGKDTFDTWCATAKFLIFFGIGAPKDAETISKLGGKRKVMQTTESGSVGHTAMGALDPANQNMQYSDEDVFPQGMILDLPSHLQFVKISGKGCGICGIPFWFKRREYIGLMDTTDLPDPAFPDVDAEYDEIELPKTSAMIDGQEEAAALSDKAARNAAPRNIVILPKSSGIRGHAKLDDAQKDKMMADIQTLGCAYDRKKIFKNPPMTPDCKPAIGCWYVKKGTDMAVLRASEWFDFIHVQNADKDGNPLNVEVRNAWVPFPPPERFELAADRTDLSTTTAAGAPVTAPSDDFDEGHPSQFRPKKTETKASPCLCPDCKVEMVLLPAGAGAVRGIDGEFMLCPVCGDTDLSVPAALKAKATAKAGAMTATGRKVVDSVAVMMAATFSSRAAVHATDRKVAESFDDDDFAAIRRATEVAANDAEPRSKDEIGDEGLSLLRKLNPDTFKYPEQDADPTADVEDFPMGGTPDPTMSGMPIEEDFDEVIGEDAVEIMAESATVSGTGGTAADADDLLAGLGA